MSKAEKTVTPAISSPRVETLQSEHDAQQRHQDPNRLASSECCTERGCVPRALLRYHSPPSIVNLKNLRMLTHCRQRRADRVSGEHVFSSPVSIASCTAVSKSSMGIRGRDIAGARIRMDKREATVSLFSGAALHTAVQPMCRRFYNV